MVNLLAQNINGNIRGILKIPERTLFILRSFSLHSLVKDLNTTV